jgi:quercetin dioxygenase-like cupin family protein
MAESADVTAVVAHFEIVLPRRPLVSLDGGWKSHPILRSSTVAIPHAKSGEAIDIRPLGSALSQAKTTTLVKTKTLEIIRLVVPSGKDIPGHRAHGEITVQCLEGRVAFTAGNRTQDLEAGQLLYLASEETHALHGIEDASILLTIVLR